MMSWHAAQRQRSGILWIGILLSASTMKHGLEKYGFIDQLPMDPMGRSPGGWVSLVFSRCGGIP